MRRRKAVGAMPVLRAKSALNEPRLWNPTSKQTWVTGASARSRRRAASSRTRVRYWCGVTPKAARKRRRKWKGDSGLAGQRTQIERLRVAGVDGVAGAEQPAEAVVVDHVETAHI